jgi:hypothetical protein
MTDQLSKVVAATLAEEGYVVTDIKGKQYSIKLLPAMQGVALANRIIRAVMPAIGAWFDGDKKEDFILPEDNNMFTEIALLLSSKLEDVGLEEIIKALCAGLKCNGEVVDFDSHFRANYSSLLLVIETAMKENFGSFFTEYLGAKGVSLQEVKGAFEALKTPSQETAAQTKAQTSSE